MRLQNIIASGAILAGLMLAPAPVAAQSFSFSFGVDGPRYHDHYPRYRHFYPRYHRFRDYRPRYRPRARVHIDLGPFSITAGGRLGHIARCEARFRSYDRRSDTYLGYDGERHRCRL
jgi:hypothetical protein